MLDERCCLPGLRVRPPSTVFWVRLGTYSARESSLVPELIGRVLDLLPIHPGGI